MHIKFYTYTIYKRYTLNVKNSNMACVFHRKKKDFLRYLGPWVMPQGQVKEKIKNRPGMF